jgi:TRAP-type mannitol/chloroaromatic compound transport system permease small subunit
MINKIIKQIIHAFAELSGWLLILAMLLIVLDFSSRGFYYPIQGLSELAVFVLVIVVFQGVPHTEEVRKHVRVTAIVSKITPKAQRVVNIFCYIIALVTIAIVVYAVGANAVASFYMREAVAGTTPLLVYPVKIIIFISCVFYWIQLLINIIKEFKKH